MDPKLFQPPVLIGERVVWLGSGSGVPQSGYVRWIGRLPEMGPGWTLGLELDNPLPYGGIDGTWGNRRLFNCETKHGLLVPATKTMKESTLYQHNQENGLKHVKPKKCIPETPLEAVTKFCPTTDLVTCDIPRPAIRRKHLLLQQTEQERPIAPKRRIKLLAKQSLLPKIYETSPTPPIKTLRCTLSSSSLNDCGTIKSLESHTTFDSFPASYDTLKSSVSVYGTFKSSVSECDISKYSQSASLCSLTSFNTLRTCRSDEYSDYQWFDAKDKCEDIFKCKYHSLEKGDTSIKNKCHIIEGQQIRLIESKYCRHIEIKTPNQNGVNFERMNGIKRQKKVCEDDDDDSSYEDATSTIEQTYSESGSCPRKDKTASGFFSFLRWFKKNKESAEEQNETLEKDCNAKQATIPSSPEFVRNISSSCGSIDTIFSTATVNSFAFVAPTLYRPFGYATPVEKGIIIEPETDTYRNRIVHRDRVRELDKNLTLRKKYHLYSSDTLLRTTPETSPYLQRKNAEGKTNVQASEIIRVLPKKNSEVKNQSTNTESQVKPLLSGTTERKKRRAPDPPTSTLKDNTLSNSLDSRSKNTSNGTDNEQINVKRTRHRRTVSDSAKDKKAGAFCHVKGKRKAPLPPTKLEATSSLGRKKRPAPQPPQEPRQERRSTIGYLTPEEKERLIANIDKLRAHAEKKSMEQASAEQVICNDSLRLEKGVLRPNKDITKTDTDTNSEKKTVPVSPRPWYKRSITNKDSVSGLRKDIFKSLEKKKEREKDKTEEWMPEVGFPRVTSTSTNNRFSIFSRSEEKKAEGEKRKSQISMLANISELDREAAEIVQKEQAREQALVAAENAKFYSYTDEVPMMGYGLPNGPSMPSENVEVPKRSSARELISLFNAIGNVTKVTVNSTFFSKEEIKKRFSFMSENVKTVEQTITVEEKAFEQKSASSRQSLVIDFNSPPSSRKRFENVTNFQTSPEISADNSVTITEIKEQAPIKPRAFHSPNPSIPTIKEQSESASTTPASTPGDVTKAVVKNISEVPEALSHTKQITIWSCPRCTLENPSWKITCEACGRWRPLASNISSSSLFPDNTKKIDLGTEVQSSMASVNVELNKTQNPDFEHQTSPKQVVISGTSIEHEKSGKEINSGIKPPNKSEDNRGAEADKQANASVTVMNEKEIIMNKYLGKSNAPKSSPKHKNDIISKSEESQILKDDKYISASNFKKESITEEKTGTISDIQKEETVNLNEVRMARIAFFNNVETLNMDTNADKPDTEKQKTIHDADERARLKEMLKEMKNSLPNRPNKLNAGTSNKYMSNDIKKHENDEGRKLGAIKKVIHKPQETTSQIPGSDDNNKSNDINAVLITTKTVYDDIKVKKSSSSKSSKVSTSVQTNAAIIQKILQDDSEKKKNTKTRGKKSSAEVIVPITVQEFSGSGIKDGVLYTSLKKDSRRLGKGTFELIQAKDFANIEATKTSSENTAVHVYANLPPTSPVAHSFSPSVQPKPQAKTSNDVISDDSKSMQLSLSRPDSSEVEKLTAQLTFQKGIDDFKADLKSSPLEKGMNTLAINRLLRRLEMAIANGEHNQAAILAKDLAKLKINCSVTRQRQSSTSPSSITVDMYVEDKVSHQGPIPLQVVPTMTVGQLKQKVQKEFEIPAGVQRWILGKQLASDDSKTLADHNVNTTGCPLFLYLVAPDGEQGGNVDTVEKKPAVENAEKPIENHETANRAGGWFYNDEEDRYSFCEDTESSEEEQEEEEEIKEDVKEVTNTMAVHTVVDENSNDEEEEEEEEEEEVETEEENELENAAAVVVIHEKPVILQAPVVAMPFVPPKLGIPTVKENIPQAGKVENIVGAPRREAEKSSTLKLGWKCPVCTLVNSPTRPGCAACTTERPQDYIIPKEYEANDRERLRLRQEQTLDNELQQARDEEKRKEAEKQQQSYLQLINLDKEDLVPNAEPFDCSVCLTLYNIGEGVVLRECLHTFCRTCLINTVQFSEEAEVKCPYRDADYACASALQEREIKALVPREVYEQHLAKSVAQAENKIGNAFHCKTPDCRGWCIFEDNVNEFKCPVCRSTNCLTCQAIHDGMNCKQYQEQMNQESETNADARRTKEMLEEMVERGEAMNCPTCQVVLMKKWGCDWLRCSMCKTEICWVTRGPRWGPGGKGDTSGGCQCGLNGIKCHPRCNYCH